MQDLVVIMIQRRWKGAGKKPLAFCFLFQPTFLKIFLQLSKILCHMKRTFLVYFLIILAISSFAQEGNRTMLFDDDWRFHRGGALGAEKPSFNDSTWKKLDLPHDWSIEDLPGTNSPFHPAAVSQVNGGFTTGGTAWYRKTFAIPAAQKGKRTVLQFDGVYMNA